MIHECCVCKDWRGADGKYFTPQIEDRQDKTIIYEEVFSHGYCSSNERIDKRSGCLELTLKHLDNKK